MHLILRKELGAKVQEFHFIKPIYIYIYIYVCIYIHIHNMYIYIHIIEICLNIILKLWFIKWAEILLEGNIFCGNMMICNCFQKCNSAPWNWYTPQRPDVSYELVYIIRGWFINGYWKIETASSWMSRFDYSHPITIIPCCL